MVPDMQNPGRQPRASRDCLERLSPYSPTASARRVQSLMIRYRLSHSTAAVVARLAYGEARDD